MSQTKSLQDLNSVHPLMLLLTGKVWRRDNLQLPVVLIATFCFRHALPIPLPLSILAQCWSLTPPCSRLFLFSVTDFRWFLHQGRGWGLAQSTHCIRSDLDEQVLREVCVGYGLCILKTHKDMPSQPHTPFTLHAPTSHAHTRTCLRAISWVRSRRKMRTSSHAKS